MSVTDWWLGQAGINTATVVCRANTTESVTVTYDGNSFIGNADSSVKDGVVAIPLTGVSETRKPYYVNGVYGGTLRSKKQTGPWYIASGACWGKVKTDSLAYALKADYDLDLYIALGDFPYCGVGVTAWGETTSDVTTSIAASWNLPMYYAHHRQQRLLPGIKELKRNVPFVYMADDHEYPMDDARPTYLSRYQADVDPTAIQADLDVAWIAARTAITAYATGNPVNTDPGIDSDAIYFRATLGPLELFVCDLIHYGSPPTDADTSAKRMLGSPQQTWVVDYVNSSTATFKALIISKQFWRGGGNTDTYAAVGVNLGYQTDLKDLLWRIKDTPGVFAIAGDQHRFTDQQAAADALGAGYPAISCLVGSPTSVEQNASAGSGYPEYIVWRDNGPNDAPPIVSEKVVALLVVTEEKVERFFLSTKVGLISRGHIEAGSNVVKYPQMKFG